MINSELIRSFPFNIPQEDLNRCHEVLGMESWQTLKGQKIFITGGTGFVGKWLLGTLLDADSKLNLNCQVTLLSRDPTAFLRDWPEIVNRFKWITGDVRTFPIDNYDFDVIIHAATEVVENLPPEDLFSICCDGTRRVLELAKKCRASKFLLISSGAVYGPLPSGMTHVPETFLGGPDPLLSSSAYGEGKRVSEWLAVHASSERFEVMIARVFALVGPHLPLDKHFAIGNFIQAAIKNEEIIIKGDGTPYRSYLYAADMAAWLWAILLRGKSGYPYNVGSDESISIFDLASRVCRLLDCDSQISVLKKSNSLTNNPLRYVPDISRMKSELMIPAPFSLDDAIIRTAKWNGDKFN
jgi:dTDP-glucose 4,6-dehydratase